MAIRRPLVGAALRLLERSSALLGLLVLAPLLLLVAVAIRLDSPGPVVFRQVRVGQYGRPFVIYKFRTMRTGADRELQRLLAEREDRLGAYVKLEEDPRVTRLGALLRSSSVDELPQLVNVVRGEMSLVGPRPQTPAEEATYDVNDWRRLLVRPGLTGLWQVSGRSEMAPSEALALDERYVREWSPMLDLRLLLRTVRVVLSRRGAH